MKSLNEALLLDLISFIEEYQRENGKSPSFRMIQKNFSYFKSIATVSRYVGVLNARGLLKKDSLGGIAIAPKLNPSRTVLAPLIGTVTCGVPIYATENIEGNYALPAGIFGNGQTFLLHAQGESMINAGIKNNDLLVVKKTEDANNGDIVVALIDDEATVKRFFKRNGKIVLHAENEKFKDIILNDVKILGKVVSCIHHF